jgi:hypothetical protein
MFSKGGQPLDESFWHVTEYYDIICDKVLNLDKSLGECYKIEESLPTRMCHTPMKVNLHSLQRRSVFVSTTNSVSHVVYPSKRQGRITLHELSMTKPALLALSSQRQMDTYLATRR